MERLVTWLCRLIVCAAGLLALSAPGTAWFGRDVFNAREIPSRGD